MNFFRQLSLSKKLLSVTMLVTMIAMLIGFFAVAVNEYYTLKNNTLEDALLITKTVSNYSAADIAFQDKKSAAETLSYLKQIPSVLTADLFDLKKQHFISLQNPPSTFIAPDNVSHWHSFQDDTLYVIDSISDKGRDFGYIQISFSTVTLTNKLISNILAMLLILVVLLAFSFILTTRLQRVISEPLLTLANTSQRVAREANYSVRVNHDADDEIGTLYTAFNQMLQQLEQREISRCKAEEALRQSEEQWRSITEYSPDYIMRIDETNTILFINRSLPALEKTKAVGLDILSLFPADYHDAMQESHQHVWDTGEPSSYLTTYTTPEDNIHFEFKVGPVFHNTKVIALTISARDISNRLKTEENLSRFRAALDGSNDNIFLIDPDNMRILDFNRSATDDLGYSKMELLAMGPQDLKPEYSKQRLHETFQQVIESKQGLREISTIHRRKDGSEFPVEVRMSTWQPTGEAPLIIAMARDISERLKSETEIRKLSRAVEQTTNTIIITDTNGIIEYVNPAFTQETGYTAAEAIGKTPAMLSAGETDKALHKDLWETISAGRRWQGEMLNRKKNGKTYWESAAITPIKNDAGEITHYLGTQMDITERKRIEVELANHRNHLEHLVKERTKELESVNQELETFAYSVSHDLRAPLRAIDGFSLVLLEDYTAELDADGQSYLQRVRSNTQKMGTLIDDILELSKVTRIELIPVQVDLSALANETIQLLKDGQPDHQATVTIQPGLSVMGDKTLLNQVLVNLLGNAWKYSGKIENAHIEFGASTDQDKTIYYVKDNGAGFDEKYADKLFSAFKRLHRADEFEGSGVGLATVARIIRRHGGNVWAEGKVNHGATFYFTVKRFT